MRKKFYRKPRRDFHRVNEKIRVPEVRVIDPTGEQIGVLPTSKAIELAKSSNMDLVEISTKANPPVTKIIDYGKFKYELAQKRKENKKNQTKHDLKEIRLRPKIDQNDFKVKMKQMEKFFIHGDKVKVKVQFRGRENIHKELGFELFDRVKKTFEDIAEIDLEPKLMGRNLSMVLTPISNK